MTSYQTVTTRSGTVAYTDTGRGPAALFVHGVATSSHLWRKVIAELADVRRCVALDLPLHGRSPARPGQDFSLGALADVLEDFCAALGLSAIDLVANDTGGAIAQIFVARHPERLQTFALTNCETHDNVPSEEFKPTVEAARTGALAEAAVALVADPALARAGVFGAGYEHPEILSDEDIRTFLMPVFGTLERAREFERFLVSSQTPDGLQGAETGLRTLDVPTLVVWGTGDQFFEVRWAHWLKDTIPGVTEVVEIDGAKLFFPHERPLDLAPHLRRHWLAHR